MYQEVIEKAIEVFGKKVAFRWLSTPQEYFGWEPPLVEMGTDEGVKEVMDFLIRLEHGTW